MGPNTRQEAILDIERDILDSLKRLSKYTTEMTSKKLQAMPYDVFTRKQAALPQFKKSYAIGQFALQETDNNTHHDE